MPNPVKSSANAAGSGVIAAESDAVETSKFVREKSTQVLLSGIGFGSAQVKLQ